MSFVDRPAHLTEPRWVRGILLFLALGFLIFGKLKRRFSEVI